MIVVYHTVQKYCILGILREAFLAPKTSLTIPSWHLGVIGYRYCREQSRSGTRGLKDDHVIISNQTYAILQHYQA